MQRYPCARRSTTTMRLKTIFITRNLTKKFTAKVVKASKEREARNKVINDRLRDHHKFKGAVQKYKEDKYLREED